MHVITSDAIVIGVDTHKDIHVAVAINSLGVRLGTTSLPTTGKGYRQLVDWARYPSAEGRLVEWLNDRS